MALQVGIVGLPNVGKSTLFNAISAAGAEVANYPFATIEPNVGVVPVPDDRVEVLAELAKSPKAVPTSLELVDIAGLVRGASRGEGLGNQFLSHIREVDAVVHVVRCFTDPDVAHVLGGRPEGAVRPEAEGPEQVGTIDAARDVEVVQTELLLKDLETVERRLERMARAAKSGDREAIAETDRLQRLAHHLQGGRPARTFDDAEATLSDLQLLTTKPVLYAANVDVDDLPDGDGNAHVTAIRRIADEHGAEVVVICAEAEAEIAELDPSERAEFLADLGLKRSGLEKLVHAAYRLLGLITFFTAGPKEARAWTLQEGTKAPQAAGQVHSDMQRGFIRAEVIAFGDYADLGGEQAVREAGLLRVEGKDYVVRDGDVIYFRFNV